MEIRKKIRKIISEIYGVTNENDGPPNQTATQESAKEALIALSRDEIPMRDIIELKGELGGAEFEEGYNHSEGEVDVKWVYKGIKYSANFYVSGSFYLTGGYSGDFGTPVDTARAPEPSEHSKEEITLEDKEVYVYDDEGNEFHFDLYELGPKFKKDLESYFELTYNSDDQSI